jgi:hypothetical protein
MMTLDEILNELEKMSLSEKQNIYNALKIELMTENKDSETKSIEPISETIINDKEAQLIT